jgi:alanine racemase
MRPILATISQSALKYNLSIVKNHAPKSKVMAVVKANAYGHGLFNVAHALNEADGFAVLGLNEAIDLREAGFTQTILLLEGVFEIAELNIATSYLIDIVVHNLQQVEMLEQVNLIAPINVHLKMNSGMNRLGFTPEIFAEMFERLKACQNVAKITLMTHFATADEPTGIAAALARFKLATQTFHYEQSLANSACVLLHPESHAEWVRPGIILYGATPVAGKTADFFGLKPVMQLSSQIIAIQMLEAGDSVGYGNRFTATKSTRVGIVACGYADGYPRHAPNATSIAVNGKLTKTLGRVSMDMLFCDLTELPEVEVGAEVELWGKTVPVDDVAEASGTVGYELLCAVAARVPVKVVD